MTSFSLIFLTDCFHSIGSYIVWWIDIQSVSHIHCTSTPQVQDDKIIRDITHHILYSISYCSRSDWNRFVNQIRNLLKFGFFLLLYIYFHIMQLILMDNFYPTFICFVFWKILLSIFRSMQTILFLLIFFHFILHS